MSRIAELVAELCDIDVQGADDEGGCTTAPPADELVIARAEETLRGPLPRELRQLLAVTGQITGPGFGFDFEPTVREDLGLGPLFQIYDYGNGDGWYLEPRGERCVGWWCGHDPYFLVRLDDSLEAYLTRAIAHLHAWRAFERAAADSRRVEPPDLMAPRREVEPTTAGALLSQVGDSGLVEFLGRLPSATKVYDLRGITEPVEVPTGPPWQRHGDVVAVGVAPPSAPTGRRPPLARPPRQRGERGDTTQTPVPRVDGNLVAPLASRLWRLGWQVTPPTRAAERAEAFAETLGHPLPAELEDWLCAAHSLEEPVTGLLLAALEPSQEGDRAVWMLGVGGWLPGAKDLFWQPVDTRSGIIWLRRDLRLYPIDGCLTDFLERLACWTEACVAAEAEPGTPPPALVQPAPGDDLQVFGAPDGVGGFTADYITVSPTEPTPSTPTRRWWQFWRRS